MSLRLALIALAGAGLCLLRGQEPFRISVDVDLVVLHATVRDRNAQLVTDLAEGDFEVFEDGVRQTIRLFRHEDTPVTVGLVVDHSGSMRTKLADVVAGARRFARASNPRDQMFVINFNENVNAPLAGPGLFTSEAEELERAIIQDTPTGKTALYDAIAAALDRLRRGDRDKRALIVISDGGDNASTRGLADVLRMAALSSALIYTVGVFDAEDPDRNPGVLKQLAKTTGGDSFFPPGPAGIAEACDRIALDIRQHYTVGFLSSSAVRNGGYRSIRVVARRDGKKLSVRARAGYVAGSGK